MARDAIGAAAKDPVRAVPGSVSARVPPLGADGFAVMSTSPAPLAAELGAPPWSGRCRPTWLGSSPRSPRSGKPETWPLTPPRVLAPELPRTRDTQLR